MINAGQMDRVIAYAPVVFSVDDAAGPVPQPGLWTTLWAKKDDVQLTSESNARQSMTMAQVSFTVDFVESIVMPGFVRYDNQLFELIAIEEIGYRQYLKLQCRYPNIQGAL